MTSNNIAKWALVICIFVNVNLVFGEKENTSNSNKQSGCPDFSAKFRDLCYLYRNDKLQYQNASDSCASNGGTLAQISDNATLNFIVNMINKLNKFYWLGINKHSSNKEDEWSYMSDYSVTRLHLNLTNTSKRPNTCLVLSVLDNAQIIERDCSLVHSHNYICEIVETNPKCDISENYGKKCYVVSEDTATLHASTMACRALGGIVVEPKSDSELEFLKQMVFNLSITARNHSLAKSIKDRVKYFEEFIPQSIWIRSSSRNNFHLTLEDSEGLHVNIPENTTCPRIENSLQTFLKDSCTDKLPFMCEFKDETFIDSDLNKSSDIPDGYNSTAVVIIVSIICCLLLTTLIVLLYIKRHTWIKYMPYSALRPTATRIRLK